MKIAHFYHMYAGGAWAPAAFEHAGALAAAGFPVQPRVGIVGEDRDREVARDWVQAQGWEVAAEAEQGYEQVTLDELRKYALGATEETHILYTHTKGARNDLRGRNTAWRREMTARLVGEWRACQLLLDRHDAVGCGWKNSVEFKEISDDVAGIFAGNFWWATSGYLRSLPAVGRGPDEPEGWIGQGRPDVADLLPGWILRMGDGSVLTAVTPMTAEEIAATLRDRMTTGELGKLARLLAEPDACPHSDSYQVSATHKYCLRCGAKLP